MPAQRTDVRNLSAEIVHRYLSDDTMTGRRLATEYSCSPQTIGRILKEWEVTIHTDTHARTLSQYDQAEIARKYRDGMTTYELAVEYDRSSGTIFRYLLQQGEPIHPKGWKKYMLLDETEIVRKYLNGMSTPALALEYDCSSMTIRDRLIRQGVQLRDPMPSGPEHPLWTVDPTYGAIHRRVGLDLTTHECWACGTTTGQFFNSCINPTRWVHERGRWLLVGRDSSDYLRMCLSCSTAYDQRIRNEALAEFFGVPLPCS